MASCSAARAALMRRKSSSYLSLTAEDAALILAGLIFFYAGLPGTLSLSRLFAREIAGASCNPNPD